MHDDFDWGLMIPAFQWTATAPFLAMFVAVLSPFSSAIACSPSVGPTVLTHYDQQMLECLDYSSSFGNEEHTLGFTNACDDVVAIFEIECGDGCFEELVLQIGDEGTVVIPRLDDHEEEIRLMIIQLGDVQFEADVRVRGAKISTCSWGKSQDSPSGCQTTPGGAVPVWLLIAASMLIRRREVDSPVC